MDDSGKGRSPTRKALATIAVIGATIAIFIYVLAIVALMGAMEPSNGGASTLASKLEHAYLLADAMATLAFSISGSYAAVRHISEVKAVDRFVGLRIVAAGMLTGVGGGIVRDAVFIVRIPVALSSVGMVSMALLGTLLGMFVARVPDAMAEAAIDAADFAAVGLMGVLGFATAQTLSTHPEPALTNCVAALVAMVTSCAGGMLRDLMLRRRPFALAGCYLLLSICASIVHVLAHALLSPWWSGVPEAAWPLTVLVTMVIGMVTRNVRF